MKMRGEEEGLERWWNFRENKKEEEEKKEYIGDEVGG